MATNTLSILKPSVNNLTTRIFVRAAGLDFAEDDMWGKKGTPEFLQKDPADLTPLLEEDGLPEGLAVGELRDHAVPLQQARARALLPDRARSPGDGRQRDVLPDRHALSARRPRHLSGARRSRSTPARSARSEADDAMKATAQQDADGGDRRAARGLPRVLPRRQRVHRRRRAVDRRHPPRRDARVPARDRLRLPGLGEEYMAQDGGRARGRLLGAGAGRARLRRLRHVACRLSGRASPAVSARRSPGASSISSPRRPALTWTVSKASADSSITVGSGFRWPSGLIPPAT